VVEQTKCVYDAETQLSALLAAVKVEEATRDFYSRVGECVEDKTGRILLNSLASDEQEHMDEIQSQIKRLSQGADLAGMEPATEFMDIIPAMLFPLPPAGICLLLEDEMKVMKLAIDVERRKGEMFRKVADSTEDCQLKEAMTTLADRNKHHRQILEDNLFYLERGGSWYGYVPILDG
jgi:rubrerythrin